MRTIKQIDFWIQVILIAGFATASLINMNQTFIVGYFIVGAWQIISMIVHQYNSWNNRKGSRRYYYNYVTVAAILLSVCFPFIALYVVFFTAPLMAVYYTAMCYNEAYHYSKRPLELI